VTDHAGEAFYEAPNQQHLISKNASGNEPPKMLVFVLIDKDQKLTLPLHGD
jgi:hypothetical protein